MSGPVPGPPRAPRPGPPAVPGPVPAPGPAPLPVQLAQAEERLTGVADRPLEEQVGVYDDVHRLLQDALAALDDAGA